MHLALSVCASDHGHGFHGNILEPWDAFKCPSPPSRLPSLVFPLEVFRLPGKWSANIETSTWNMNYPMIPGDYEVNWWLPTTYFGRSLKLMKDKTPFAFDFPHHFFGLRYKNPKNAWGIFSSLPQSRCLNHWSTRIWVSSQSNDPMAPSALWDQLVVAENTVDDMSAFDKKSSNLN